MTEDNSNTIQAERRTYAVTVTTETRDGHYTGSIYSPTFYLDSNVQGIVSEDHAASIVRSWLTSTGLTVLNVTVEAVSQEPESRKVYILVYSHRHGNDVWTYKNPEQATERLAQITADWWDSDGPGRDDEPLPADPQDRISRYFEYVSDESYILDVADV